MKRGFLLCEKPAVRCNLSSYYSFAKPRPIVFCHDIPKTGTLTMLTSPSPITSSNSQFITSHQTGRARDSIVKTIWNDRNLSAASKGELLKILDGVHYQVDATKMAGPAELVRLMDASDALPLLYITRQFHESSVAAKNVSRYVLTQLVKAGWDRKLEETKTNWGDELHPFNRFDQSLLLADQLNVQPEQYAGLAQDAMNRAYAGLRGTFMGDLNDSWMSEYDYARFLSASAAIYVNDPKLTSSNDLLSIFGEQLYPTPGEEEAFGHLTDQMKNLSALSLFAERAKEMGVKAEDFFDYHKSQNQQSATPRGRHLKLHTYVTDLRRADKMHHDNEAALNKIVPYHHCANASAKRGTLAMRINKSVLNSPVSGRIRPI